jgi:glycosyltransferase involved in cell wall biosynthesis
VIKLSACMMAKNEADNIERCLRSLVGVVDEIILVDTGSTDETMEIAKKYGAKIYEHPWSNNFSIHRNQSIGYATGDWILIIDCDEELDGKILEIKRVIEALKDKFNAIAIPVHDYESGRVKMQFNSARLFKRDKVHYENSVHNQPKYGNTNAALFKDIVIKHYGYDLSAEKMALKRKRTIGLLEERLAKDAEDYPCHFYLSQIYGCTGEVKKVKECAMKYLEYSDKPDFNTSIYYTLLQCLQITGGYNKTYYDLLLEAKKRLPDCIDICFAALRYYEKNSFVDELIEESKLYIDLYRKNEANPALNAGRFIYAMKPEHLGLAVFHLATLHLQKGVEYLRIFKNISQQIGSAFEDNSRNDLEVALSQMGLKGLL